MRKYEYETGRFISIDPLWGKYYGWTPYQYSMNSPVMFVDINGKLVENKDGSIKYTSHNQIVERTHTGEIIKLQQGWVFADDGRRIEAYKNKTGDARFNTNCHGTTFAKGQVWINNDQVEDILAGDGYSLVLSPPHINAYASGDVVIYRGADDTSTELEIETGGKNYVQHSETVVGVSNRDPNVDFGQNNGSIYINGLGGQQIESTTKEINNPSAQGDYQISIWRK